MSCFDSLCLWSNVVICSYEANKKQLQALQQENPEFVKSVWADQVITDEEALRAQQLGYGRLEPGDFRKFAHLLLTD
jgi:uncharacterized protein YydD (DUF2326 family)